MTRHRIGSLAIVFMLQVASPAGAAPGDHAWSKGWSVSGRGAATDAAGSVAAAGIFSGTVNFGGGAYTNTQGDDVFVVKLDGNGNHIWSGAYPPSDFVDVTAVASSPDGDTYVAGNLTKGGTIDFGGGPIGGGIGECWAVRFDRDGNHVWSDTYGRGIIRDIDATNTEVAFAARTVGTLDFGGGALGATIGAQAVAVKLASDGTHIWSAEYGDAESQTGLEVGLLASGDLVLLASVRGSADFGGGALTADATADDLALARFDASGGHVWSKIYAGSFGAFGVVYSGMDVTLAGAIAITGQFTGTIDFGGTPMTASGVDMFVTRIDSAGNHVWSRSYASNSGDSGMGVAFDLGNNLLVAGYFEDDIDFGGGTLSPVGSKDAFVLALDTGGAHLWSAGFGTVASESRCEVNATPTGAPILDVQGGADLDFGGGPVADASYYLAKLDGDEITATPSIDPGLRVQMDAAPNPFASSTTIRLAASTQGTALDDVEGASLAIFDVAGHRIRSFADPDRNAGAMEVRWDGRTDAGVDVVPGVYFLRLDAPGASASSRLVRVR